MGWNELWTRDPDHANAFYPAVFGYLDDTSMPGSTYWQVDVQMVGGCMTRPPDLPPQVPAPWAVSSCTATSAPPRASTRP